VTKPVMSQNTKKFLKEATSEEIKVFELVAGDVLDALGYERTQTRPNEVTSFSAETIAQFDAENQRLKALVQDTMDQEDRERRARQNAVLEEIKQRRSASVVA
jgi:hypothetical protein